MRHLCSGRGGGRYTSTETGIRGGLIHGPRRECRLPMLRLIRGRMVPGRWSGKGSMKSSRCGGGRRAGCRGIESQRGEAGGASSVVYRRRAVGKVGRGPHARLVNIGPLQMVRKVVEIDLLLVHVDAGLRVFVAGRRGCLRMPRAALGGGVLAGICHGRCKVCLHRQVSRVRRPVCPYQRLGSGLPFDRRLPIVWTCIPQWDEPKRAFDGRPIGRREQMESGCEGEQKASRARAGGGFCLD